MAASSLGGERTKRVNALDEVCYTGGGNATAAACLRAKRPMLCPQLTKRTTHRFPPPHPVRDPSVPYSSSTLTHSNPPSRGPCRLSRSRRGSASRAEMASDAAPHPGRALAAAPRAPSTTCGAVRCGAVGMGGWEDAVVSGVWQGGGGIWRVRELEAPGWVAALAAFPPRPLPARATLSGRG